MDPVEAHNEATQQLLSADNACHILRSLLNHAEARGLDAAAASIGALIDKTIADAGALCQSLVGADVSEDV